MAWVKSECPRMKPPYKNDILLQAKVMAHAHGLSFDTKNGLPSDKWFFGFRRRNKLSDRVVQHLAEARIQAAREVNIGEWYRSVRDELDQQHVTSTERTFNMDEAGHPRCYNTYKGVAAARRRPAWSIQRFGVCVFCFCVCLCRSKGLCTTWISWEGGSERPRGRRANHGTRMWQRCRSVAAKINEKIRKLFQTANEAKVQVVLKTQQRLLRECEREKQQRDKAEEEERKRQEKEERVRAQAKKRAPAQPEPPAPAPAPAPAPTPAPAPASAPAPEPAPALADSVGRANSSGNRRLQDLDIGVGTPPSAKVFRSRLKYPNPPQAPTNITRSGRASKARDMLNL